ncbi:unnamed protein product [Microthlaspi erraticum]|uniref:Uncharacterized protein n=1 Tax=Microthlaspi erraticum TaxID=1685480 RepID=A0A6D2JH93_9BRAS|nr:unnamed protein product [Microthlaspi erraticum]
MFCPSCECVTWLLELIPGGECRTKLILADEKGDKIEATIEEAMRESMEAEIEEDLFGALIFVYDYKAVKRNSKGFVDSSDNITKFRLRDEEWGNWETADELQGNWETADDFVVAVLRHRKIYWDKGNR